ncbi:MAG: M23 family metallopeptidase [Rhodomicrobium sp.]
MRMIFVMLLTLPALFPAQLQACQMGSHLRRPAKGEVSRDFGFTRHPILHTLRLHSGQDYQGAEGDSVFSAEAGVVANAGIEGGYGNYVRIDHGGGLQTAYAHLKKIKVKPGECVSKGEVIGSIGRSGIASSIHLHFEVIQNGRFIDPAIVLAAAN